MSFKLFQTLDANFFYTVGPLTYQMSVQPKFVSGLVGGSEKTEHTTQKPVSLMEHLIKIHTDENQIVLDPFMGSGTTGVACKNLNRNFIGIELDDKYFEITKDRVGGEDE